MGAVLGTEITKLKRTWTLWLSVICPAFILLLWFIVILDEYFQHRPRFSQPGVDQWFLFLRPLCVIWTVAVVPILVAVEAACLTSPEHAGKHWKQLYSMPIPRWRFFAAKTVVCGLLLSVSSAIFGVGVLGLGLMRSGLLGLDMVSEIPWELLLRLAGGAFLASMAVIAVQMWLSMRFAGFVVPVGIGMAATIAGGVISQLKLTGWWPWSMPLESLPWGEGHVPVSPMLSPVAFAVLMVLAGWRLARAEIVG
jgi:ABC-2 type transport system permease protein